VYLVIGSTAAHYHLGDEWRRPKDVDVYVSPETPLGGTVKVDAFWDDTLQEYWPRSTWRVATLDELYTIKVSHVYWDLPNNTWSKHVHDILSLKSHGAQLIPDLHSVLYKVWEQKHGKKRVDLNMDKADFFDDAVPRKWDHDSIHYSVSYGDHPLYESFNKDGEEVAIDMRKVWAAPLDTQIKLFREEIYATALERWVVPSDYTCSPGAAYLKALRKTIVSLTKGRSARFIVENLDTYIRADVDYVQRHKDNAHKLVAHRRKGQ
jgi:hypothetical protein